MIQKIKISKVISYLSIFIAIVIMLGIFPTKLIRHAYQAKSDEVIIRESDPVSVANNITQMFIGIDGELKSVDLYVCNDMASQVMTFRMYDENHEQIYEQFVSVPEDFIAPDFLNIPIRYGIEADKEYSFIIEGLTCDLYVAYEDRMTTTSPVNYIMAYGGEELSDYDVVIRYNFACPFSIKQSLIWMAAMLAIVTIISFLARRFAKGEVEVDRVIKWIINPILVVAFITSFYILLVLRLFGPDTKNNLFLMLGISLLLALIAYIINFLDITIRKIVKFDFRKYLQIIAIATALWYCYEYMNGLYDIFHYYSVTKLCIACLFIIIVSFDKKEILNIPNAIWLIAGPIFGYFYYKPYANDELYCELYRLLAWFWVAAGFVAINIIYSIIRIIKKKVVLQKLNLAFTVPFTILLVGLCVFSNGREWPFLLLGICLLLGFRLIYTGNTKEFRDNLCLGIILNFYMMMSFSVCHRVYYFYRYYRYYMGFHTVTVTAYYLSMVIGASFVRVISQLESESKKKVIPSLITFGFAASYLIFTMSRTGFLSTGSMLVCGLIAIAVIAVKNGEKVKYLLKRCLIFMLATIYMFPITYMLTDLGPRICNDPVTFEVELRDFTFYEGMPYSSPYYMTIEQFIHEFGKKVFGKEDGWITVSSNIKSPFVLEAYAMESTKKTINQPVFGAEADVEDMSNGRFDIFKSYVSNFNLTGHEEMGVELPDGEIAYHAHNSFIQAMHDFGIIMGLFFLIFMIYGLLFATVRFIKTKDLKVDTITPVLAIGFCAASMVEWLFHPCNPYCFVLFLSMIPMMAREK